MLIAVFQICDGFIHQHSAHMSSPMFLTSWHNYWTVKMSFSSFSYWVIILIDQLSISGQTFLFSRKFSYRNDHQRLIFQHAQLNLPGWLLWNKWADKPTHGSTKRCLETTWNTIYITTSTIAGYRGMDWCIRCYDGLRWVEVQVP